LPQDPRMVPSYQGEMGPRRRRRSTVQGSSTPFPPSPGPPGPPGPNRVREESDTNEYNLTSESESNSGSNH
jgi:hypothetical protein